MISIQLKCGKLRFPSRSISQIILTESSRQKLEDYCSSKHLNNINVSMKPSGCKGYKLFLNAVAVPDRESILLSSKIHPAVDSSINFYTNEETDQSILNALEIDYITDETGIAKRFLFRHELATQDSTCGCGNSFGIHVTKST
eukprot:GHVH01011122.1.p1 GENE.GHVH01011122.1~~GHVH01011122.1.p1  ORF type:complete len:143 (-),score=15.42 GHVH01011122.1:199-627(-)